MVMHHDSHECYDTGPERSPGNPWPTVSCPNLRWWLLAVPREIFIKWISYRRIEMNWASQASPWPTVWFPNLRWWVLAVPREIFIKRISYRGIKMNWASRGSLAQPQVACFACPEGARLCLNVQKKVGWTCLAKRGGFPSSWAIRTTKCRFRPTWKMHIFI